VLVARLLDGEADTDVELVVVVEAMFCTVSVATRADWRSAPTVRPTWLAGEVLVSGRKFLIMLNPMRKMMHEMTIRVGESIHDHSTPSYSFRVVG
jgi:hypothetical protein